MNEMGMLISNGPYITLDQGSDPDRSLNRKKKRFKVFEVEPRSNWGQIVMTS